MRLRLLDLLACPTCHGRLTVPGVPVSSVSPQSGDNPELRDALLTCRNCAKVYPVHDGVPSLLPTDESREDGLAGRLRRHTARFYGYAWRCPSTNRAVALGYETHLDMVAEVLPFPVVEKGIVLDAGCGGGRDLRAMASRWPEIEFVGVDLSDGVYTARERVNGLQNAHVIRGDLLALPFPEGQFDTAYSYGVLHHTGDPVMGMRELVRVVKPAGRILTYVYEDFSHSRLVSGLVAIEAAVRRVASRLPPGVLYGLCVPAAPVVFLVFTLPSRALRHLAITRPLAEALPFRHAVNPQGLVGDLYDRFVPVCHRFSRDTILGLYRSLGLSEVGIVRRRGWITWGRKAAAPAPVGETQ